MDLAPIYGIDVGTFRDANGDGVGDLRGVTESLDHVERLGAGWIWLLPFFTSPMRDNGYDVADHYRIHEPFGTFGDFVDLVGEARRRNIKVMIDLVVNHTSDQHSWFRAARADPDGPFRDYYVWTDSPPPLDEQPPSVFPDRVPSVWTWDEAVGAFYFHQFYPYQPSLNHLNPVVHDELRRLMGFWMELGVGGFRIDAAGHLGEPMLQPGSAQADRILRRYRSFVGDRDCVLLGEADLPGERLPSLLGPDRLQMLFDFIGNAHLYLAFATESAEPIVRAYRSHGDAPDGSAWVHFLRNLDEVDLERLERDERELVMDRMAPNPRMRIFHRGVRRRLAPLLDGDPRRIRLAFSILFAHPGAPMIVYGDEIGMGDDQSIPERGAVRTAMQWTSGPNAGFSHAPGDRIDVPIVRDPAYAPERVNVADQEHDPDSLLSFVRHLSRVRRETAALRGGGVQLDTTAGGRVLTTCSATPAGMLVTLANLSPSRQSVPPMWPPSARPEVLAGAADRTRHGALELDGYGFAWLRVPRA